MIKSVTIKYDTLLAAFLKLFIIVNLFFPYRIIENGNTCVFILSNFVAIFIIIMLFFWRKKNNKDKIKIFNIIFIITILIYEIIAGVNNIEYNHYFIEQINKTISFILFILCVSKIDSNFIKKYKIIKFLIVCINVSVGLSCLFYLKGGEVVTIENLAIKFIKTGGFSEHRLTWIYGHKSTYGLFLMLYLSLILKFKKEFNKKINFYFSLILVIVASVLTASATTLILVFIILGIYNFHNYKRYKSLLIILIPIAVSIFIYLFNIALTTIENTRDLSTVGNRLYIYKAAQENLILYPYGVGKQFGDILINVGSFYIDNFHNIFLNEMFRFSVPVGILYALIYLLICIYCIRKSKIWAFAIWISCYIAFFMDYSLRTEQISFFLFMIYINTIYNIDIKIDIK